MSRYSSDESTTSIGCSIIIIIVYLFLIFGSRQSRIRSFGGEMNIILPANQELMEVTWKGRSIHYLTRPMTEDYVPQVKTFSEKSAFGIWESKLNFIETKLWESLLLQY